MPLFILIIWNSFLFLSITDIKLDVGGAKLAVLDSLSSILSHPAFRLIAIEFRQSTHIVVSTFFSRFLVNELLSFTDVSGFEPPPLQGKDTMTFFSRS